MSVETVGATGAKVLVSQTFMAFEEPCTTPQLLVEV